jgi:hypothetical protein
MANCGNQAVHYDLDKWRADSAVDLNLAAVVKQRFILAACLW